MFVKRLIQITSLFALLAGAAAPAWADGLYSVAEPVASQSPDARTEAFQTGLQKVLVRVTGQTDVTTLPGAEKLLNAAGGYVAEFRYQPHTATPDEQAAGKPVPTLDLWMRFDADAVDRAVRQAGWPLWGRERPVTVVWALVRDGGSRTLVSSDSSGAAAQAREAIKQEAARRGLPVVFPIMDAEDQQAVSATDISGGFGDRLLEASKRYNGDAALGVQVEPSTGGSWEGTWTLWNQTGQVMRDPTGPAAMQQAVAEGIDDVANRYAARYALTPSLDGDMNRSDKVLLAVSGVSSLDAYGKTVEYLRNLTVVKDVTVHEVAGDTLHLELTLQGSQELLKRTLDLGRMLSPAPELEQPATLPTLGGVTEQPTAGAGSDSSSGVQTLPFNSGGAAGGEQANTGSDMPQTGQGGMATPPMTPSELHYRYHGAG